MTISDRDRKLARSVCEILSARAATLDGATRGRLAKARAAARAAARGPRLSPWWLALPAVAMLTAILLLAPTREASRAPPVRAETFALLAEPGGIEYLELAELYLLLGEEATDAEPRS